MTHSVLIAAYKAAAFIPKALASLRAQIDDDWELIVVEDGSRDDTEAIVRAFAASVPQSVCYENEGVNRGVAATRSALLELANGELLSFLDADDWWEPGHLTAARREANAGADFIVSDISQHDIDNNRPLGTHSPSQSLVNEPAAALFRTSEIRTSSAVTIRRSIVRRAGLFEPSLRIGEDRDYWLRCALAGAHFALTHKNTCTYSKHATSTMTRTQLWADAETAFYEKHQNLDSVPRSERSRLLAHALQNQARLLRKSDPKASARLLQRAWKLSPANLRLGAQWAYSSMLAARSHG